MNPEIPQPSIYRPRTRIDIVMVPAYGLAEALLAKLSAMRRRLAKGLAARRRERAIAITINQLSAIDDRVLRDIGISRGDIHAVSVAVVDDPGVNVRNPGGH